VDKTDYIMLKRIEARVEDGNGFTIMTLPQGLTLNIVRDFAQAYEAGNSTGFAVFSPLIIKSLGDVQLSKTVTVAITNGVFIDSRNKSVEERKKIVEDLKCEVPGILAATNLGIMRFIMSPDEAPVRLFSGNPKWTWTLCIDKKKDEITGEIVEVFTLFGGFGLDGPTVENYFCDSENEGVAGLWEFKVLSSPKTDSLSCFDRQ
jgi:hypothetical protein